MTYLDRWMIGLVFVPLPCSACGGSGNSTHDGGNDGSGTETSPATDTGASTSDGTDTGPQLPDVCDLGAALTEVWSTQSSGDAPIEGSLGAIAIADNGQIFAAGVLGTEIDATSMVLATFGPDGAVIWTKVIPPEQALAPIAAVASDANGNKFVLGSRFTTDDLGGIGAVAVTQKYDPAGETLWENAEPAGVGIASIGVDIAADDVGGATVVGNNGFGYIRRFGADGATASTAMLMSVIVADADIDRVGELVLGGAAGTDAWVEGFDSGNLSRWMVTGSPGQEGTDAQFYTAASNGALARTVDGSTVYATAEDYQEGGGIKTPPDRAWSVGWLTKVDLQGTEAWSQQLAEPPSFPYSLDVDSEGKIYILENTPGGGGMLRAFTPEGASAWDQPIDCAVTNLQLAVDSSGDLYLGGGVASGSTDTFFVGRYTPPA